VRELEILAMNDHPAVIHLLGFSLCTVGALGDCGPVIITPPMQHGTISDLLRLEGRRHSPPNWNATAKTKCVFGIAAGMAYLPSREVMHRDVKPETVIVIDNSEPLISDFEVAKCCSGDPSRTRATVGSPLFMAPDIFMDEESEPTYDLCVDVHSFGVLLHMLFSLDAMPKFATGQVPRSVQILLARIGAGVRYERPSVIPDYYSATIQKCWAHVPSFAELMEECQRIHECVLDGANIGEVVIYEDFVTKHDSSDQPGIYNMRSIARRRKSITLKASWQFKWSGKLPPTLGLATELLRLCIEEVFHSESKRRSGNTCS
jgi:serine/threonine protein kinase